MMKIAFFDSGIGGISVLYQALKLMPKEDYLYYADTDHVPYGVKDKAEIKQYILDAADFIMAQDVKALVVACNTATSVAIGDLRKRYAIPILGMEPAVKPAVGRHDAGHVTKRILVTATPMTLREEKLQRLLRQWDHGHIVDLLPLPGLVTLAESGHFADNAAEDYLRQAFAPYRMADYCTIVLGCTHFNFFKDTIAKLAAPETAIIDGSFGTICYLEHILSQNGLKEQNSGQVDFYTSGRLVTDSAQKERYYNLLRHLDRLDKE